MTRLIEDEFLYEDGELPPEPPPLWPVGLAVNLGIIGLCCYEVLRKLHVPARHLAPGERVA